MSCDWPDDFEIAPNVTYGSFEPIGEVCPATYIRYVLYNSLYITTQLLGTLTDKSLTCHDRPDPGGSMMPWLPTLVLLFFHLPACIIRAVRWESAQYLVCLRLDRLHVKYLIMYRPLV